MPLPHLAGEIPAEDLLNDAQAAQLALGLLCALFVACHLLLIFLDHGRVLGVARQVFIIVSACGKGSLITRRIDPRTQLVPLLPDRRNGGRN